MRDKHLEAGGRPRGEKRKDDTMLKKSLSLLLAGALTVSLAVPAVAGNSQAQPKQDTSYGTTYYLDASIGKTDGDGLTPANAFDSLEDINAKTFQPGDQILIQAGTQYTGTLWPKGSGCEGYPIVIDMYGQGDKPLIDGNGAYFMPQVKDWQGPFTGQTGDQIGAAVYLYNQEYIEINNLEVKNQGDNVNRDRSGIRVEGYDYGVIDHIYIRNCYVHDVRETGKQYIDYARTHHMPIIVACGRPYHIDPEINHGINDLITGFGFVLVTEDALSYLEGYAPRKVLNQWTFQSRMYNAARYVCTQPDMQVVQLVSFGCGTDAITTDEMRDILEKGGKLYTQLKIDDISNLGAVRIRVRSLMAAMDARRDN